MDMTTLFFIVLDFFLMICLYIVIQDKKAKAADLSKTSDTDLINELTKRGILTAASDGSGLCISSDVLREVHFNSLHAKQMQDIKNSVDFAASAIIANGMMQQSDHK